MDRCFCRRGEYTDPFSFFIYVKIFFASLHFFPRSGAEGAHTGVFFLFPTEYGDPERGGVEVS